MFKFLKEKLKGAVSQISDKIEEEGTDESDSPQEEVEIVEEEKKGFFGKIKDKFSKKEEKLEEISEEKLEEVPIEKPEEEKEIADESQTQEKEKAEKSIQEKINKKETPSIQELAERKQKIKKEEEVVEEEIKEEPEEEIDEEPELEEELDEIKEEKKGLFSSIKEKITTKRINEKQFDEIFWNLEIVLLENNIAVEVIDKIKKDLKLNLVDQPIKRGQTHDVILNSLKDTITNLFEVVEGYDFIDKVKEKKPFVMCFVGINGSGKTTTIAKFVKLFQDKGLSCVLAAADTFRAAAIDQLQKHADKLDVKMIKHDYGSDAAAVAFDAVKHAQAKGIDVVLIDTAGRMHSNVNLMEEIEKLVRVANPDFKIFVGEAITGNDCTEQAKKFNESIGIDGIVLSKADIDEKGGAAISVSYVTGKPILYIGTGQEYSDLSKFDPSIILKSLDL